MRVAIIGIGIHKFGRTPELSGVQQGAQAARHALQDCGLDWRDMQFGYGGSYSAGNADALGNELGLTGMPFTNARPTSLIQRLSEPEEIANMVVYACSDGASSTTGASLRVEGGIVTGLG